MPEQINDTTFEVTLLGGDKVEIGGEPFVKLNRWGGECFIAVKPANLVEEEIEYEVEGNKVKCKYKVKYEDDTEEEFECGLYPLEPRTVIAKDKDGKDVSFKQCKLGGFEFEVILKKKPVSNKVVLDIETQGLKFFYQPPFTQQEITNGAVRPDNVVGSYAVYHATKRDHIIGKTNYKAGKAFHIYRPKITDADGKWVWGELHLDEKAGILTTEIPQDFLDSAVYPVSTGTTNFGWDEEGLSDFGGYYGHSGSIFTTIEAGTAISMSASISGRGYAVSCMLGFYLHSTLLLEEKTSGFNCETSQQWSTANLLSETGLDDATEYLLMVYSGGAAQGRPSYYGDAGDENQGHEENEFVAFPSPIIITAHNTNKYSIYITYEGEAPPEGQPYISRVQGIQGMRSWGGI